MSQFSGKRPWAFTVRDGNRRTTEEWKQHRGRRSKGRMLWPAWAPVSDAAAAQQPAVNTSTHHTPDPRLPLPQHTPTTKLPHTVILSDLSRARQSPPPLSLKTSLLSPMPCMSGRCRAVCDARTHTHSQYLLAERLQLRFSSASRCAHQTATRDAAETHEVDAVDGCWRLRARWKWKREGTDEWMMRRANAHRSHLH